MYLSLCIGLTAVGTADAQSSPVVEYARARWEHGMAALERDDLQGALADVEAAYESLPDPQLAEGVGIVECRTHRYAAAELHLKIALENIDLPKAPREAALECLQKVLTPVGTLVLEGVADGAVVSVDDEPIGRAPIVPWSLEAGKHIMRVHEDGYADQTHRLRIEPGIPFRLTLGRRRPATRPERRRPAPAPPLPRFTSSAGVFV
jgi:hypothetical protein